MVEKTEGILEFKDWQKLDLRVGKIEKVDFIEGADKLYKLKVNLGEELGTRTLVAGLKPYYTIEELENKIIIVFTNLQPRSLMGTESQGMILAAVSKDEDDETGKKQKVKLLQPDSEIELGAKVS